MKAQVAVAFPLGLILIALILFVVFKRKGLIS